MESLRGLKEVAEPKFNPSSAWSKSGTFPYFFVLFTPYLLACPFPQQPPCFFTSQTVRQCPKEVV